VEKGKGKEEGKNRKESKKIGRNKRRWVHGKDGRVRMGQQKKGRKCDGKRTGTERLRWRARKGRKRVLTGKVRK
jgi:hypothetical protein